MYKEYKDFRNAATAGETKELNFTKCCDANVVITKMSIAKFLIHVIKF